MSYYMSRYTSPLWYTFEFIVILCIFGILLVFWKRRGDKSSLIVYLFTGIAHSIIELVAQGLGVREVSNMYLFNLFQVTYPFTALIMGFFEGGMFCLIAYQIIRILILKDKFSLKFVLIYTVIMVITLITVVLTMDPATITISQRAIFAPISLILLSSFYLITFLYFLLKKDITSL